MDIMSMKIEPEPYNSNKATPVRQTAISTNYTKTATTKHFSYDYEANNVQAKAPVMYKT